MKKDSDLNKDSPKKQAFSHDDALKLVKGNFFKEDKAKDLQRKEIKYDLVDEKIIELLGVMDSRSGKDTVSVLVRVPESLNERIESYNKGSKGKAIALLIEYALDELEKTGKGLKGVISKV